MDVIPIDNLKRNPDIIKKCFKKINSTIICTKDISIVFPERYINKNLANIGSVVKVVSIYAILDGEGNYAIVNKPIFIDLTPTNIKTVEIDGVNYKELIFEKYSTFTTNTNLVMLDKFMFDLFDMFFIQGKVPWYLNYEDVSKIFIESKKYANNNVGENILAFEILTSIIARDKNDKTKYFRKVENKKSKPVFIGLQNIWYTFDNTISKLVGAYFDKGITSALVNKEEKTTKLEEILRA